MSKDLTKYRRTIAKVLTDNKTAIFNCSPNIQLMKETTIKILQNSEELKRNSATSEAILILRKCNGNKFLSTLVTYMSGIKVS